MKKYLSLILILCFAALCSFGQTTKEKLNKLNADPKTKENAAKADSFIINKKIITSDSTKVINEVATKKRECKRKSKNKKTRNNYQ